MQEAQKKIHKRLKRKEEIKKKKNLNHESLSNVLEQKWESNVLEN